MVVFWPVWRGVIMYSIGGMVAIVCMSVFAVSRSFCGVQLVWLIISMVFVCASPLAPILAQWVASRVVL